ncbi:MAG: DNA gyrase inhibitor YacG [Nannocystaceae bacterium]|nr:DNA gyrase inhibitor YacG [Myxococcales bacterium]
MQRPCPTCGRVIAGPREALPHRPFCSERCRLIDLRSWLDEEFRISTPLYAIAEIDDELAPS